MKDIQKKEKKREETINFNGIEHKISDIKKELIKFNENYRWYSSLTDIRI